MEFEASLQLKSFGLGDYETDLIIQRFIRRKSMVQIVKDTGWLTIDSAAYYLKQTIKKLRAGKFVFK